MPGDTIVEGKPIRVGGREWVPLARVETCVRRWVDAGARRLGGGGTVRVRLRPVALVARDGASTERLPVRDKTAQVIGALLLVAFVVPLLTLLAERLVRKP